MVLFSGVIFRNSIDYFSHGKNIQIWFLNLNHALLDILMEIINVNCHYNVDCIMLALILIFESKRVHNFKAVCVSQFLQHKSICQDLNSSHDFR